MSQSDNSCSLANNSCAKHRCDAYQSSCNEGQETSCFRRTANSGRRRTLACVKVAIEEQQQRTKFIEPHLWYFVLFMIDSVLYIVSCKITLSS